MDNSIRRVAAYDSRSDLQGTVQKALAWAGVLGRIGSQTRVVLKPNLTYPWHKEGVTTSPAFLRATLAVLREVTPHLAIVESDGGYGAWSADEAFRGHGIFDMAKEVGAEVVNLCNEERELLPVRSGLTVRQIPVPSRLLRNTDVFITMPVPKVHAMTGLSLSMKNQWGCVPDPMRLRLHFMFDEAIVAINKALKPAVLSDGTHFLDRNGPMEGEAVRMDLAIAASDVGSFDRYVSEVMGVPWRNVRHLRLAARHGIVPPRLEDIESNVSAESQRKRVFHLKRTPRSWIALSGFRSRTLTWFGYESWFGRVVLHSILYAIVGRPVDPRQARPQ
jgi:uncharacterized protein (DUF362 family)